jgi:hypothetical protein
MDRMSAIQMLAAHDVRELSPSDRARRVQDWSEWEPSDPELQGFPENLRLILLRRKRRPAAADPIYDPLLNVIAKRAYVGVTNEYLETRLGGLGIGESVDGQLELLHPCLCCRHRTLAAQSDYEICPVCFWENDGVGDELAYSGPNRMTLAEGRHNYERLGACEERFIDHVLKDGPSRYPRD